MVDRVQADDGVSASLEDVYAGSYFLFAIVAFSKTPNIAVPSIVSLLPLILIGVGILITPVIGGYQAKRISRRKFKGPPN